TVFATHYHELTQLTEELAHARNFNVAVREVGDEIVFLHRLEPGGADRSYGIHVGRLAGLPAPVVARAWQVLQLLEAGHHVARQPAPLPPDAAQLALFGPSEPHPLLVELERLDVNALSPPQALNRPAAWAARPARVDGLPAADRVPSSPRSGAQGRPRCHRTLSRTTTSSRRSAGRRSSACTGSRRGSARRSTARRSSSTPAAR